MSAVELPAPAKARPAWGTLGATLIAAILIYVLEITFVISFGALLFAGELSRLLPQALGLFLLAGAISAGAIAVLSSYPGSISGVQDTPGAVLAVAVATIAAALPGAAGAQFATVMLLIVISTTLTGALMLALGVSKLGRLVRFLPYPVMGGFLAGTGWLLAIGGLGVMISHPFGAGWLAPEAVMLWLPGVALGLFIYAAALKVKQPYVLPGLLLLATAGFYVAAGLTQTPIADLRAGQWLFEATGGASAWQFALRPGLLAQVDWGVLAQQLPAFIPVALISVIALLLNTGGLELVVKKDIDLNQELVAAGAGNLAGGLLGGLVGYQAISLSALAHAMRGRGRLVGLVVAGLVAASVLFGPVIALYIPKFVLGAVLFYLGFDLLVEWVYQSWFKFPRLEYLVILVILAVIITTGFLEGILVGLALAAGMFVVSYSRVSVIKFTFNARDYRSRMVRRPQECDLLTRHGACAFILKLEGYIFFGTANSILAKIREQVQAEPETRVRYIVLDFAKVTGLDSTGLLSFSRLAQWSQERGSTLMFTGLGGRVLAQFAREPALSAAPGVRYMADLDRGLEWCENEIIREHRLPAPDPQQLAAQLRAVLPDDGVEALLPYLQRRDFDTGEYLMKEGDQADVLYFVESGQVTVQLERPGRPPMRLETIRGGRTVGELGFYLGTRRNAHVVAEAPSVAYALSVDDLQHMARQEPAAASRFHQVLALLLSERVSQLTRTVGALEDG